MLGFCTCSRESVCVQRPAAAAATGAFTGSLGRNTSVERDTRACPRAAVDQGACWEKATFGQSQGGGRRDSQSERARDQAGQLLGSPASIPKAPGDPGQSHREQRRSVRPAHHVGSEAQQPGGAFVLRGLPLSCLAIYRAEREMKQKQKQRPTPPLESASKILCSALSWEWGMVGWGSSPDLHNILAHQK